MLCDFIEIDVNNSKAIYIQLYEQFKEAIISSKIAPLQKMPSIRKLSQELNLSRTTIESAYSELAIEGYIQSKPQSGYYVCEIADYKKRLNNSLPTTKSFEKNSIKYNFSTDYIDPTAFSTQLWQRYIKDILHQQEIISSYGDPQGEFALRQELVEYARNVRNVRCNTENLIISAGTQPLLYILSGILRKNKNIKKVAMESPVFRQAQTVFNDCSIEVVKIKNDINGISIDELIEKKIKCLYINPAKDDYTNWTYKNTKRLELLEWAKKYDAIIIEDDHNGELRYTTRPIPSLQGVLDNNNIIYIGSFSKIILPSVRVGYMVLPFELNSIYQQNKSFYNQTASKIEQLALAKYIRQKELEKQLKRLRRLYKSKGELLEIEVKNTFKGEIESFSFLETALKIVIKLKGCNNCKILIAKCQQYGVKITPYSKDNSEISGEFVLGFGGIKEDKIKQGVELIYKAYLLVKN